MKKSMDNMAGAQYAAARRERTRDLPYTIYAAPAEDWSSG